MDESPRSDRHRRQLRVLCASAAAIALVSLTHGAWAGGDHVSIASGSLRTAPFGAIADGTGFVVEPVDDSDDEQQQLNEEQLQESMQEAEEQNEEAQQQAIQDEEQAHDSDPQVIQNAQQG